MPNDNEQAIIWFQEALNHHSRLILTQATPAVSIFYPICPCMEIQWQTTGISDKFWILLSYKKCTINTIPTSPQLLLTSDINWSNPFFLHFPNMHIYENTVPDPWNFEPFGIFYIRMKHTTNTIPTTSQTLLNFIFNWSCPIFSTYYPIGNSGSTSPKFWKRICFHILPEVPHH